jgi:hypothetical protein
MSIWFVYFTGIWDNCVHMVYLTTTTTITKHHCHHFPTLTPEHLSLALQSNLPLHSLHTLKQEQAFALWMSEA